MDIASALKAFGAKEFDAGAFGRMASPEVMRRFEKHRRAWGI
jgi:hypothetical protein